MAQSWTKLGQSIASTDPTYLEVTIATPYPNHLRVVANFITTHTGGTKNLRMQFNGDDGTSGGTGGTGSRYSQRESQDGGNGSTNNGADSDNLTNTLGSSDTGMLRCEVDITNYTTKQKMCMNKGCKFQAGVTNRPIRRQTYFKWMNSAVQISTIRAFINNGTLDDGSILTVYGTDDLDTTDKSKDSITNVPTGTRYEETDTRKIYRREIGALDNTTGLVMHYKLNESSGDVINYGTAGTNQNLAVTGLTRDVATPSGLDNGMSSVQNGSDYAQGTTPQRGAWDFFQQDDSGDYTGTWSICFWFKASALPRQDYTPTETHLIGNIWTDDDGAGFEIRFRGSSNDATPTACKLQLLISNGTTMPINSASSSDMIPDITDWHFYCLTYDANAASNNLTMSRDAATSGSSFHQGTDTSNAYSTGSPTRRITFFAKDDGAHGVGGTLAQVLVFKDRILTQAEKVALYASGNGISALSSSWKEKGTA